jgi:glycosyltransferase involved in cell wall biosynthesis
MGRSRVSATILTFNNASTLEECLKSVQWVDEIIVVDSFSQDATLEIARRYTPLVYQRQWPGFISQRNFAKERASGDWILWVDADEVVSEALRDEMERALAEAREEVGGYLVPRCTFYLGRWIRHGGWYPDLSVRLFRREAGHWAGQEPHAKVVVEGKLVRLKNDLLHFNYRSFGDQIRTIDRYSDMSALEMYKRGAKFRLYKPLLHPLGRFLKEYILKQGFRDGIPGLVIVVSTMYYVFAKHLKLWELERGRPRGEDEGGFGD